MAYIVDKSFECKVTHKQHFIDTVYDGERADELLELGVIRWEDDNEGDNEGDNKGDVSKLSKDDIMAKLEELGIEFNKRDSKDKLLALLEGK